MRKYLCDHRSKTASVNMFLFITRRLGRMTVSFGHSLIVWKMLLLLRGLCLTNLCSSGNRSRGADGITNTWQDGAVMLSRQRVMNSIVLIFAVFKRCSVPNMPFKLTKYFKL